jgi:hypothetical protein
MAASFPGVNFPHRRMLVDGCHQIPVLSLSRRSDVHVMLGLRLRFQQIVVANEIFDRTDVIGQRLGK